MAPPRDRVAVACLTAIGGCAVALALWQWLTPPDAASFLGLSLHALADWRRAVGLGEGHVVSLHTYNTVYRSLLIAMWLAYAVLLSRVHAGTGRREPPSVPTPRQLLRVAIPLVALLTLLAPPLLSGDVFAYVGYGRLAAIHHMNPHLHTQRELVKLGDPTGPYLRWPIASPYGPLWTVLSMLVVLVSPTGAVLVPVVIFKLLGAAALVAMALLVRRLVLDLGGDQRSADGALAAVIANPVLLFEGPGSAHNDLAMMVPVLIVLSLFARGRVHKAAVMAGVAAAVKLVPLMLVPWLAVAAARARPRDGTRPGLARLGAAAAVVALAMAPLIVAYAPFWSGLRTFAGLATRWSDGQWIGREPDLRFAAIVGRIAPIAIGAGAASLWAVLAPAGEAARRAVTAWAWAALVVLMFATGVWYPWYLAWVWPVVLVRTTFSHRLLAMLMLSFSLLLTLSYTVARF